MRKWEGEIEMIVKRGREGMFGAIQGFHGDDCDV